MGTFPALWKKTYITPVFKKGSRSDVKNYRPISKLCIFAKIFDKIVSRKLTSYFLDFVSVEQHGFLPSRSTISNLLEYKEFIVESLSNKWQVDSVNIDLKAAFDSVDHNLFCSKLRKYGIADVLVSWIHSFLASRELVVKYQNFESYIYSPQQGIPQGSCCGPLAFIIFLNDIYKVVCYSKCLLYADDLKLFISIKNIEDADRLQCDMANLMNI